MPVTLSLSSNAMATASTAILPNGQAVHEPYQQVQRFPQQQYTAGQGPSKTSWIETSHNFNRAVSGGRGMAAGPCIFCGIDAQDPHLTRVCFGAHMKVEVDVTPTEIVVAVRRDRDADAQGPAPTNSAAAAAAAAPAAAAAAAAAQAAKTS